MLKTRSTVPGQLYGKNLTELEKIIKQLPYGIDARVLGNSRELDTWDELNPSSFDYTYDYKKCCA